VKEITVASATSVCVSGSGFTTNSIQISAMAQNSDMALKAIKILFALPFVSFFE
jgi:hypothetical protein